MLIFLGINWLGFKGRLVARNGNERSGKVMATRGVRKGM